MVGGEGIKMKTFIEQVEVKIAQGADVIVVGGGIAGVAAAVSAARNGAEVLLLEKTALLGGLATNGLINWYEPLCDGCGEQLMTGMAEELLRLAIQHGDDTLPQMWRDTSKPVNKNLLSEEKKDPVGGRYGTYFSPTIFQLALDELLQKEGVRILLDIVAVRPIMEEKCCVGVCCESKSGREFFPCKVIVDASGDSDVLYRAGAPCAEGDNYFTCVAHQMDTKKKSKILDQRGWMYVGAALDGTGQPEGEAFTPCLTNEQVTDFLLRGRAGLLQMVKQQDKHHFDIATLPTQVQARKTRRLAGAATLTEADNHKPCDQSIGLACDFLRPGDWYEIPWGCLHTETLDNVLAAGRMISSTGWAWDVTRVIPVCALTGQVAGLAAAQMSKEGVAAKELEVKGLQEELEKQGVRLHYEDKEKGIA